MSQNPIPPVTSMPLTGEAPTLQVTSMLAISSVILGVAFCVPLGPLLGVILGVMGLWSIEKASGALRGRRLALAGVWLGAAVTVFQFGALFYLVTYQIPHQRQAEHDQALKIQLDENASQVRTITEALIDFADANNGHMPGLDHQGRLLTADPGERYQLLVDDGYLKARDLIMSKDQMNKHPYARGRMNARSYSYAILDLTHPNRLAEWKKDANSAAPLVCDRNIGKNSDSRVRSMWGESRGEWIGNVGWGDGHASTEKKAVMPRTVYNNVEHNDDNLFADEGSGDAYLIYGPD